MTQIQLRDLCTKILEADLVKLGMMLGIVSRIQDDTYEVFAVSSETGIPSVGDQYELRAVYCRQVCETEETVAITEINGVPGMRLHPLYEQIPCEAYISSPIFKNGKVWGTLNFTSFDKRQTPFSPDEIAHNENRAAMISSALQDYEIR